MPLPEAIPVRYTEEEAGYITTRPVVRQSFRPDQLLDMVLSVTGKDAKRIRPLVQSNVPGTVGTAPFGSNVRAIVVNVEATTHPRVRAWSCGV